MVAIHASADADRLPPNIAMLIYIALSLSLWAVIGLAVIGLVDLLL